MEDLNTSLDPDELMDLEEVEASDIDEDEEDNIIDDPLPSPLHLPSSGPASAATSAASSPPTNEDTPPIFFTGKPLSIKRGRGRPRREGGKPSQRRSTGTRMKRWKPPGYSRGSVKRVRGFDRSDIDFSMLTQSPGEEMILDPETGALILTERVDKPTPPIMEELPYAPENWPGKVCGFCNLGERSQLGQGEMLRLMCPEGFTPERVAPELPAAMPAQCYLPDSVGDKSPRGPVTCRRQKSFNKCRNPSMTSEYVDELTLIGHAEEPEVQNLFESAGHFYVHRSCAYWANGVVKLEHMGLDNVGPALLLSSSRKCNFCNHYGASISCRMDGCSKIYHLPCATAAGAFQELNTRILYCSQHLSQVALNCEGSVCYTCKILGDIANLMYCSLCGEHYHGTCVGLAQLPGVRAGWQCRKCRICQTCRMVGDETKLMACEQCDKVYHSICQRPIVTTIPKYGWKCRCCRVCGDCGSRTPGAGLSSRWHAHYTVCDSCYQQRNKGYNCPLCHRAYRAHAHREMVQCTMCRKFVHGTCDPAAELMTYHERKQVQPDYEYVCLACKNISHQGRQQMVSKRNSIDEDSLSASQESLYDDISEFDMSYGGEESMRSMGLGKGKPYACKIAKKRLGYGSNFPGRPKGVGKGIPGKVGFMKKQKMSDFGRKRGPKYKMRGVFGVPGVGLQRPTSDGSKDEEPGIENRLVLCSAKDKYVLTQDICVMCGAIGTDQEGCLISCVQCGQCYHPYCVNVKVTKVILQKGWRCLDCTVCEGCGLRDDESRLILCDDCDISYHIYCMDPPLHYVPHGNWKCKWCVMCQMCGATDPGFNCNWMNSFAECGPCASLTACASCSEAYNEGDLIIQCVQCERWLHGACDSIKTDADAEKCAEDGYNCILCRPRDVPPPHLLPTPTVKPPTPTKSPEIKSNTHYYLDGVFLSEAGHNHIKTLCTEQVITRKKRKKLGNVAHDKEAGIMATIESVIAGSAAIDNSLEDAKLELVDVKDEPQELYKEGMTWSKEDGPPPEGFTIFTTESGPTVLRRKRQRNLQKLGIGGFVVRVRGRGGQDNDEVDMLPGQTTPTDPLGPPALLADGEKPRRKPMRRKPKSKLSETFPAYLQEAFFGKELLDSHKDFASSSSEDEHGGSEKSKTIHLSQDEIKAVAAVTAKQDRVVPPHPDNKNQEKTSISSAPLVPKEEDESDTEALKDVLAMPGDLLDPDLVNTIMNEENDELTKNTDNLDSLGDDTDMPDSLIASNTSKDTKDELSDILGSHFIDIPMGCKDVEDIFKGVLTDESQESQESNIFPLTNTNVFTNTTVQQPAVQQHTIVPTPVRPSTLPTVGNQNSLNSPMSFPPQSPYHSEYSNSPQFSPAFSGPPSPWVNVNEQADLDSTAAVVPSTYNQRSSEKMKADEGLGQRATISAVLYANMNHIEWKTEFPAWSDRYKQIIKKWRTLSNEQKAPYLQQAKDNRSALRMKKQQQISKESSASPHGGTVSKAVPAPSPVQSAPPPPQPVSEVCTTQQSRPLTTTTSTTTTSSVLPPQHNQRPASITPPSRPASVPPIQHQFTVHGPVPGPGDLCHGPAPNVTVNPLYAENPPTPRHIPPLPPTTDHQIRVLTPSEIMRTLPSLCQETCESPDQEKIAQQQKTAREQEQERQWKQLQALRQQQAQQQQHVIQEQRVQGMGTIVRVQRQLSETGQSFLQEQLQVTSPVQEGNLHGTDSAFSQPNPIPVPVQPKQLPVDPYAHQPATPRPNIVSSRPTMQGFPQRPGEAPEVHRQLRDLLQRQQFKKLDEQLLPGKGQQRVWPPSENSSQDQDTQQVITPTTSSDTTFRHPLPPGIIRQRLPGPTGTAVLRQSIGGLRMQLDPRLQGMDPRMRLILQQQQQRGMLPAALQQQFQQQQQFPPARFVTPPQQQQQQQQQPPPQQVRPTNTDLDQLLQRNNVQFQQRQEQKLPIVQSHQNIIQQTGTSTQQPTQESGEQEIPDNFTAELEKLEQEGSMVELQGVGDILGGLGDDDDELLAEMGAGFNILKYADPELDDLTSGEKGNILDSLDLVDEPDKDDKKDTKIGILHKIPTSVNSSIQDPIPSTPTHNNETGNIKQTVIATSQSNLQPPPLVVTQSQPINPPQAAALHPPPAQQLTPQQQIHQQMLQQVQQVAAMGRPMPPGTRLLSQDGIIGTVTSNNNVSLTFPPNYGRVMHVPQNQKMQMRLGGIAGNPRLGTAGMIHGSPQRMPVGGPPPPPPPYPGPPPPYPGSSNQQMGPLRLPPGLVRPFPLMQRRPPPLLLEEQPLLLEDLLEQEKREQEKQLQTQTPSSSASDTPSGPPSNLLSEHDFERLLKSEIMSTSSSLVSNNTNQVQGVLPITQQRASFVPQSPQSNPAPPQWQQVRPPSTPTPTPQEIRVPTFQANLQPTPPLPPDQIITEQDKQTQMVYEQWLNHQNNILGQQLKFYETEVQKLRKIRKSLNSKQRQLRKSGNQLGEADAHELQKISAENNILQKHLESSRKQSRQHGMLIQDYRNKQQAKQGQMMSQPSPLGPPASSPIHPPQSPMMSPSASPMMQHSSPLHSPAPSVSHSPGPGSVSSVLQSPSNPMSQVMSPSPRIGTPHSQSEGSPGPVQSPSMHLPPPMRMTSPQHRRVVTSPIGYTGDLRPGTPQARFARPPLERTRLQSPSPNFQSKPGTPSPLNSPPPQQINQQLLQRHLQQQAFMQQTSDGSDGLSNSQRTLQLIQQRQYILRQQQQQAANQPLPLTPQQHQLMVHQQQQLAKQQQQQIAQLQAQQRLQPPHSPMPPQSPQIMSPLSLQQQSQPPSPMPPRSPMINFGNQPPNSPMPRSPAVHQNHPPSSPMVPQSPSSTPKSPMIAPNQSPLSMRRPPSTSNSPAMPDRPTSVGPYANAESTVHDSDLSGGGNPHNPNNPIPYPPGFGRYGYFKLGLRGGSPMWGGFGRGAKRIPENKEEKTTDAPPKFKKEPHLSKVSILKKKSPAKINLMPRLGSLVSSDYNELDDSSSTPPVTPPPMASTSRVHKSIGKNALHEMEQQKEQVLLIESTTSGKQIQVDQIMDYDDDNDAAVVSAEVSLNSAAQPNDTDEIAVTEIFTHSLDALSSPLESDQIPEDFVLFDIDAQYSDKEEEDYDKDMQIVNVAIQSPTTSEEEMIMQGKTGSASGDGSALNLVQGLSSDHLLDSDSPEQEEPHTEPTDDDEDHIEGSQIVIIDTKQQEEQISTKEDFEELIDEGKIIKPDTKHISEIHKYAQNVFNLPPKSSPTGNVINLKSGTPKVTLIPFMNNLNKANMSSKDILFSAPQGKNNTSVASIILPIKTTSVAARHNLIGLPKFVSSSPAITIVSASTSQIASILPSRFTVPVISASAVSKLPNVKVIDKPSSSLSLTTHQDTCLPKKIFEDDSVSPDSSNNEDDKKDDVLESKDIKQENTEQSKEKQSVVIHSTPELKMTAQVIQESQGGVQIARSVETMPFIMTQSMDSGDVHSGDDTKSVVISIPSPTPSQEQMLDNIALQALENRRRDGNGIPGGFDSLEDVLDMIENITGEPSSSLDDIKPEPLKEIPISEPIAAPVTIESPVTVSTSTRPTVMPQLSPLSQPTELTTNMANVSQQLRTLLSNLHTTTVTTSTNIETSVKSVTREKTISTVSTMASVVSPRIIQNNQERSSPISTSSTVIVPNLKKVLCSPNRVQSPVSSTVTIANNSHPTLSSLLPGKTPLMPDHPKLPTVTTVVTSNMLNVTRNSLHKSIANSQVQRKPSLSLNAMLQSHPAATVPQTSPGTITTASILGSPIAITRPSLASLAQAQPHVISPLTTSTSIITNSSVVTPIIQSQPVTSAFARATTNLLHTHLTKSPMIRSKVQEDEKKELEVKKEPMEISNDLLKQETPKYQSSQSSNRTEDSQNVLLKQLLQNTACATSQSTSTSASSSITTTPTQTAPSLPIVPNLEAQLARPVPPTPTSLLPPILQNDTPITQPNKVQRTSVMSRETSFVSKLPPAQPQQQLHIDIKKGLPPSRTPSRDDLLSPATPRSSCSQESSLQTPPLIIKKEPPPQPSPILTPQEVKKEFMDESSQHSEVSDHSKSEMQMKEEIDGLDQDKILLEKEEMKKLKRRAYQQKRRQNQILNKEIAGQPKKRPRKSSKVDEDYDSYIESVLAQLRALPAMVVSEPALNKNFAVVPVFGSGDLSKLGTKEYDARCGELVGTYGNAIVPGFADFYNSKPYGDQDPLPEKQAASTQRGFYDQEFPLIRFDSEDDRKFDLFSREDSPDSIVSSSSPECSINDQPVKFPGLKLIDEDEDEEDECSNINMRLSPVVPIIAPIPIRLKPAGPYLKDFPDVDKENICSPDYINLKSKFSPIPTTPLKDSGNVTVTLTLTSSAAEDIMGVLRDLANILHIPAPTSYQIVERTSTPPSQKLGLYRTKGKDGKEGAPIDIQSILNGAAKFCRHCDVVILSHMIRKKVSELPFLSKDSELLSEGDELYFCGSNCYMQFALMHRSPSLSENKAAEIIDHLSQDHRRKSIFEKTHHLEDRRLNEMERIEIDIPMIKSERYSLDDQMKTDEPPKNWKNIRYKSYLPNCIQPANKYKKPTDKEIMELMYRLRVTVMPSKIPEDTRKCMFCHGISDSMADGPARLLNFDVDKWVHLNCGLWSDGVYETVNGALMNLSNALQQSLVSPCVLCNQFGATIRCFKTRCSNIYHLPCAVKDKCVFYKNKTTYCSIHVPKNEKDNELTTLSVSRRVYVDRDENRQVAAVMHHSDQNNLLRVGSLIFLNVGQLLPHQLANFHTANFIYPIGYKIVRFYWSMRRLNKRCRYVCSIHEIGGRPEFRIVVQESGDEELELRDVSCKGVWMKVLEPLAQMRRENQCIQLFPQFVSGEDLFGLTEPAVVRVLESLPGIETLTNYKFKYGRNPLLELPLAINPSGAARTEAKLRNQLHWKRPHTQRTGSTARPVFTPSSAPTSVEAACPYSKQFVHSKSSQYKKMKQEWRNNVYLARSKIQGLGLYAARDLEKHTMVIEYIGEIIRAELAETRERMYEAKNRGIYMFRLDEDRVVDATLSGGLARYINHSCNPNCVAETVEVERDLRIIIFTKRRIQRGEELAYDYKFDIEDDQHKISCMCGAPNCKKWMN